MNIYDKFFRHQFVSLLLFVCLCSSVHSVGYIQEQNALRCNEFEQSRNEAKTMPYTNNIPWRVVLSPLLLVIPQILRWKSKNTNYCH